MFEVVTDAGVAGYAACCPSGSVCLPYHALGTRAGLQQPVPQLVELDPCNTGAVTRVMNATLRAHS